MATDNPTETPIPTASHEEQQETLIASLEDDETAPPSPPAPAPSATPAPAAETPAAEVKEEAPKTLPAPSAVAPATAPQADDNLKKMSAELTRVQQELAHLKMKAETQGGELTPAQEEKRQAALEKAATLRDSLQDLMPADESTIDVFHGVKKLAGTMADRDEAHAAQIAELRKEISALKPSPETVLDQRFRDHAQTYGVPKADLEAMWTKICTETETSPAAVAAKKQLAAGKLTQAVYDEMIGSAASDLYHERAKAAKKPPTPPTASPPPPTPPRSAKIVPIPGASPKPAASKQGWEDDPVANFVLDMLSD